MTLKNIFNNSWVVNIVLLIVLLTVNVLINLQYEPITNTNLYVCQAVSLTFIFIMAALHNKFMLKIVLNQQYWRYFLLLAGWLALTTVVTYNLRLNVFQNLTAT